MYKFLRHVNFEDATNAQFYCNWLYTVFKTVDLTCLPHFTNSYPLVDP